MSPASLLFAFGLSLSAADAPGSPPPGTSVPPPLIEVHRTRFDPPITWLSDVASQLVVSASAPVAYSLFGDYLFVVDTTDGTALKVRDLDELFEEPYGEWRMGLAVVGTLERLVLWNSQSDALWVFSLADPVQPVLERSVPVGGERRLIGVLPGRTQALVMGRGAAIVDIVTAQRFDFVSPGGPHATWSQAAVGGSEKRPVVVLHSYLYNYYSYRHFLSAYLVEDLSSPLLLSQVEFSTEGYVGEILLDRRGEVVVLSYPRLGGLARFEARDVSTGAVRSSFEAPGRGDFAVLAEGGDERVLAVADLKGVDIIDLGDPSLPEVRGRIEIPLLGHTGGPRPLTASAVSPVLFVAAPRERAILSVDILTAAVIGRWVAGGPAPVALALGEGAGGRRDTAIVSWRNLWGEILVPGGPLELDLVDLSTPSSPELRGRFSRVLPTKVEDFVTVGGVYGVVADASANVLVLFRLSDGEVLDATGFFAHFDGGSFYNDGMLRAGGSTILALSEYNHYEIFEVADGRLVSRERVHRKVAFYEGVVRSDGTVVVLGCSDLWTHLPDGREGHLALPFTCGTDLRLSPAGDLALVGSPQYPWDGEGGAAVVDLSDPAEPRLLWQGLPLYASGIFLEDEERLFVTGNYFGFTILTTMVDSRTGVPLAGNGDRVDKDYYHDVVVTYGRGQDARVVLWKWTFSGWETVLLDAGTGTPRVLAILPEFFRFPDYLAREGGGWYEFQSDPWTGPSSILVAEPDGAQTEGWNVPRPIRWHSPQNLRRGFFAASEEEDYYETPDIVLWRDTALNRTPVAKAGGDQFVECDGREGTQAVLDASASSDPDSTPGTSDDIASYAWTVDGKPVGSDLAITATLPLGSHAVSLTVIDLLGLSSLAEASVQVSDTLSPSVTLVLDPLVEGSRWTGQWEPQTSARDRCDGEIAPDERLLLAPGSEVAPVGFQKSTARGIEVRRRKGELRVALLGPAEGEARALWANVVEAGGFALADGEPVGLVVAPAPAGAGSDIVTRYEIAEDGRLLRALTSGPDNDLVVEASATDAAGLTGLDRVSVRESQRALCATLPPNVSCPGL